MTRDASFAYAGPFKMESNSAKGATPPADRFWPELGLTVDEDGIVR